ncbi:SRPBCC family protein [Sphingomonas sp. LB-2]|uniref:SRPBCC family protein n=1 Tax=Sphingomonas caeni TaxID=2984949 RepID=UPI00222EF64B|nr:SRPBCC family protein [Sphingomonas caeni]MCW3847667.1 SRPBCC family protein [Sphingomonas caeni]
MSDAPAVHDRFTIERTYPHAPAKVFAAFATEEGKQRWFSGPNDQWDLIEREFDFSVGGIETIEGRWKGGHMPAGTVSRMDLVYHDIVPDRRIVYSYRMAIDGKPISVSMAAIEMVPDSAGTRLTLTEHGIYLDGYEDKGSRHHGVSWQMDKMGETLPA